MALLQSIYAQDPLRLFKQRRTVLFLSYMRFWDQQPFVQQSLAKVLTKAGVSVLWYDGRGVGLYEPKVPPRRSDWAPLVVKELFRIPGERLSWIRSANLALEKALLLRQFRKGEGPLVWVQGGFEEELLEALPHIDVFSVFDDPHRHEPGSVLSNKARLIICQNTLATELFTQQHADKTVCLFPPALVAQSEDPTPALGLPFGFPARRMGYVGSCFSEGFDFELLAKFVRALPQWGFLLQGRTDAEGYRWIDELSKLPNFIYRPWVEPDQLAATWRALHVSLLLYRDLDTQAGAFSVKVLESYHHGVPCIATEVPKTRDLRGVPRGRTLSELIRLAQDAATTPSQQIQQLARYYEQTMDPTSYLSKVQDALLS